jgi:pimeloyl-ACP methyl ester carboxylesterase
LDDSGVREFRKLVPDSEVKPMGEGSHFLPMEYPDAVLAVVEPWFDCKMVAP